MTQFFDLTGHVYGKLTVLARVPHRLSPATTKWWCACACGNFTTVRAVYLRAGNTKACGCLRTGNPNLPRDGRPKHGRSKTRAHNVWKEMNQRCSNPNHARWEYYGGRGIYVCSRWKGEDGFGNFHADMGDPPAGMSIDRIDNDGPYEPSNCKWATRQIQCRNMRTSRRIAIDDREMTVPEWAETMGISAKVIHARLAKGWSERDAVTRPLRVWR